MRSYFCQKKSPGGVTWLDDYSRGQRRVFTVRVLLENVSKFICGVFKVGASTTDLLQGIAEVSDFEF